VYFKKEKGNYGISTSKRYKQFNITT